MESITGKCFMPGIQFPTRACINNTYVQLLVDSSSNECFV